MYPIKFKPYFIDKPWGGGALAQKLNKTSGSGLIGESWEISGYRGRVGEVAEGGYQGKNIYEVLKDFYGKYDGLFPLLVKFLDIQKPISVQVHPSGDYYKEKFSGGLGKTESWYILDVYDNPIVYCGLKFGITQQQLSQAIEDNTILDCLQSFSVKPHDVVHIPAGTIHAASGVVIYEVQQTSDTTYRLYDWGHGREVHIPDAMNVIDFDSPDLSFLKTSDVNPYKVNNVTLVSCPFFILDRLALMAMQEYTIQKGDFVVLTAISGPVSILCNNAQYTLKLGESVLLLDKIHSYRLGSAISEPVLVLRTTSRLFT